MIIFNANKIQYAYFILTNLYCICNNYIETFFLKLLKFYLVFFEKRLKREPLAARIILYGKGLFLERTGRG